MPGTSLASVLKEHGYRTAFVTSADIDFSGQYEFLAHRGFDHVWIGVDCPAPSSSPGGPPTVAWSIAFSAGSIKRRIDRFSSSVGRPRRIILINYRRDRMK